MEKLWRIQLAMSLLWVSASYLPISVLMWQYCLKCESQEITAAATCALTAKNLKKKGGGGGGSDCQRYYWWHVKQLRRPVYWGPKLTKKCRPPFAKLCVGSPRSVHKHAVFFETLRELMSCLLFLNNSWGGIFWHQLHLSVLWRFSMIWRLKPKSWSRR